MFVFLRGAFGFVSALLGGDCESFFFGYVGRSAVADAVGCEVSVFEVESCFTRDFTEDVPEAVFAVAVAVNCKPERVSSVVFFACLSFVEPAFQDLSGFFFECDYPVLPVLAGFFAWDSEYAVFGVNPVDIASLDFDRT